MLAVTEIGLSVFESRNGSLAETSQGNHRLSSRWASRLGDARRGLDDFSRDGFVAPVIVTNDACRGSDDFARNGFAAPVVVAFDPAAVGAAFTIVSVLDTPRTNLETHGIAVSS